MQPDKGANKTDREKSPQKTQTSFKKLMAKDILEQPLTKKPLNLYIKSLRFK